MTVITWLRNHLYDVLHKNHANELIAKDWYKRNKRNKIKALLHIKSENPHIRKLAKKILKGKK